MSKIAEGQKLHGHSDKYNWVADFVYGGIDGAVTTFAVVAGVEGASLSLPIILILGFANLLADGFSMAVGKYLSDKSEVEQFEKLQAAEYEHLKTKPDHEREEVREILQRYNFKGKNLDAAVKAVTADEDAWVDLMMRNEFNMTQENIDPFKGGLATFVAFILIGFIPLMGYTFQSFLPFSADQTFVVTIVFTLLALFVVGLVKAKFSPRHWFLSGLETAAIGGIAAAIAYVVGFLLRSLAG